MRAAMSYYNQKTKKMTDEEKDAWKSQLEYVFLSKVTKGVDGSPQKKTAAARINYAAGIMRKAVSGTGLVYCFLTN